ncbi:leucine-rich repeat domain-containing protein [Cytophagaceae bacterium YF14B1]|uniref:Leucine-rich repeat domain-containing protein n=1 Tax=Xanthocytophaga flava TaxID=3048013 RepID=A0AAE3QXL6_9BACT|nr:leucine-rich repeat domain-containing protein [Xanthocytophaga flavus]MDJ1485035.1 leucine-rich repeat domain-containing protein [Xanthocytophaga flavus]
MFEYKEGFTITRDFGEPFGRRCLMMNSENIEGCIEFMKRENITHIEINSQHGYRSTTINFLEKYNQIEGINIVDENIDITPIKYLKNLKSLILPYTYGQELDFSMFTYLEDCAITWHKKTASLLRCRSIKNLLISNYSATDLNAFNQLSNLESLKLVECSITSLKGIGYLKKLNKLDLNYIKKLSTLDGIEDSADTLNDLMLYKCNRLQDYHAIGRLSNLEILAVIESAEIDTLKFVKTLRCLKKIHLNVRVTDGDMSPLTGLKEVFFVKKKNFTHIVEQIRK